MAQASELPVGLKSYLARYWVGKIDARPFAAFRIAFGLALFYDLCDLFPNLRTFFSDEGVLPRVPFLGQWARAARFCLLDAFGTVPLVHVFWLISAIAVLCMTVGYRTRVASVVAFVCMASFQERLPPLFDGSDTVIRMTLFWHMFCQTGTVWSVDALLAEKKGRPLSPLVPALPLRIMQVQIALIYLITGFHKIQGSTWRNGDAVHYCVHLTNVFSRPWALLIADNAFLMAMATWGTLVFEFGFMLFVFLPVPWERVYKLSKAFGILTIVSMHVGIAFTINVGLFSYLMPLCLMMFWEPEWTQFLVDRVVGFLGPARLARMKELALAAPIAQGWDNPPSAWFSDAFKARATRFGAYALVVWFAACTWYAVPPYIQNWVAGQVRTTGISVNPKPRWLEVPVQALDVWSSWDMFSPEPLRTNYHLTAPGELENGQAVNLFGSESGEDRGFWFSRWFKYFENVTGGDQLLPLEWGRYRCREWNFSVGPGEPRLYTFTLYKDNQIIPPIGQPWPPVQRQTVWVHRCFDKPAPKDGSPTHVANEGHVTPPQTPNVQPAMKP